MKGLSVEQHNIKFVDTCTPHGKQVFIVDEIYTFKRFECVRFAIRILSMHRWGRCLRKPLSAIRHALLYLKQNYDGDDDH